MNDLIGIICYNCIKETPLKDFNASKTSNEYRYFPINYILF